MLAGKKILVGISGGIAAYKIPLLVRLLIKMKAEVRVVMTPSAHKFVTPLTLSTVSDNPVLTEFFKSEDGTWNNHVELGLWADLMLVAPATAGTMAKMANGVADNLLVATYLSAKCPVFIAPAMDLDMYAHPSTIANIAKLGSFGNHIIPAASGELASGLTGEGRMEEPENIVRHLENFLANADRFTGKKVIVTAGPTYEAIDPVRFIGNHSSGKMGIEIADCLAEQGAEVVLICGPSSVKNRCGSVRRINVTSAQEMFDASTREYSNAQAAILAAAVADYKPKETSASKIKKKDEEMTVELVKNPDILATLGANKKAGQVLVGFALETDNEQENARIKLEKKNLDFIVLNSLQDKGAGFKHDTNKIAILHKNNKIDNFELKPKSEVAMDIVETLAQTMGI